MIYKKAIYFLSKLKIEIFHYATVDVTLIFQSPLNLNIFASVTALLT